MPYIHNFDRAALHPVALEYCTPRDAGELQYAIAVLIRNHLRSRTMRYQALNDVIGALAGAQQEFYRRVVAPFEDGKINMNGDVYDPANRR